MIPSPLKSIRILRGLSQAKLARALGVDRRTVQRWEAGEVAPGARQRARLEQELKLDAAQVQLVAVQAWTAGRGSK